jgi:signal peptidase I
MKVIALAVSAIALTGCGRLIGVGDSGEATAAEESLEVVGSSMEPTLHCARPSLGCRAAHDDEVVVRDEAKIERREVVAFRVGAKARRLCGAGGLYVKRVVGLAGDRVEFREGSVYVDDRKLHEPYVNGPTDAAEAGSAIVVPPDHILVLGDNRAESCDSRVWGPLAVRKVVGVGVAIQRGSRRIPLP